MRTLPLGPQGPQVSAICLGSAYFGTRIDRDTAFEMMDIYYEMGGRFIDTANSYAGWYPGAMGGESERTIGAWMASRGVRDEMFVATKVGYSYGNVPQGTSPARIRQESEKSLNNLGIERIDLYYAHIDDRVTPLEETLDALDKLVQEGKVRMLGASNFRAWRMESAFQLSLANSLARFVALENHHTYLQPRPEADWGNGVVMEAEHFDFAKSRGVRLLAYYALLKGAYVRPDREIWSSYQTGANQERMTRLKVVADDLGVTMNQVVLAWMMNRDPAVTPITVASHRSHLVENLNAVEIEIAPEQMDYLNFTDLENR